MQIKLTDAQWAEWQLSADYRSGFRAALEYFAAPEVATIQIQQPDGTPIVTVERVSVWQVV